MELKDTLKKINNEREKVEACFVFSLWKNPELYEDYISLNESGDTTLQNEDAIFYYNFGKAMYKEGYRTFDHVSCETFLTNKDNIRKKYESYGGYPEIKQLLEIVDVSNVEAYFDNISKMNNLSVIAKKYDEVFSDVDRFKNASSEDVYNTFELLNNSVALTTNKAIVEDLTISDDFLNTCNEGEEVGLSYAKGAPILNYSTLGAPVGDMYLFAGHSGTGKTSFIFENMVIPFSQEGIGCAIISNEMRSKAYKFLLLSHVLTHDLNYWKLTRKKLKIGGYTQEDWEMLHQAQEIINTKYSNIKFVKLFDNNTNEVIKFIKKFKAMGVKSIVWDTMKNDDSMDDKLWQQLLMNSRKVFNEISKNELSMIVTFQLALYTTNQRYLDAGCLSNSKQVKEVVSEMVLMRRLWQDEYTGEKYDCKPYRFNRDNKKVKEMIELDPNKIYCVCFLDKTRNDQDKITILYEWQAHYNRWSEVGYCTIINEHRSLG